MDLGYGFTSDGERVRCDVTVGVPGRARDALYLVMEQLSQCGLEWEEARELVAAALGEAGCVSLSNSLLGRKWF